MLSKVNFMVKSSLISILCLLFFQAAVAQKDTSVYYFKNSGKHVSTKDSADYFVIILPPDSSADKNLFIVKAFYPDGKINFIGKSSTNTLKFNYKGPGVFYYHNGNPKKTLNFENDQPVGDVVEYYPNGKLYNTKSYTKDRNLLYKDCRDSTGKVLTEKGNGNWMDFDESFKKISEEGQVIDGFKEGEWRGRINDSVRAVYTYKKGIKIASEAINKAGLETYSFVEVLPEFPDGARAFFGFLGRNISYPPAAKEKGMQGRVLITFVVEKDGSLSNIGVLRGIGDGCDEEAVRVMKLSPPWKPGYHNGIPVRMTYSVPVVFNLSR